MNKRYLLLMAIALFCNLSFVSAEVSQEIKTAISSEERPESESSRDKYRKPEKILSFLGVKPGMKVIDLNSGGGYYTDILSRIVGEKGEVIAHNVPYVVNRFADFFLDEKKGWQARLQSSQWRQNVTKQIEELDTISLPPQLDAAIMVLFYHDTVWQGVNREMMNRRIYNALKPGGVYMIVDHSAKEGSGINDVQTLHRIEKRVVIEEITKVGFKLDTDSDILSHQENKRDYSFVRDAQTKRDRTDRMVLKFVKPVQ